MTVAEHHLHEWEEDHDLPLEYSTEEGGLKIFGFWVFLVTDMLLFACVFSTYAVLFRHTNYGPTPVGIFDVKGFTAETLILLTSSFTSGLGTLFMRRGQKGALIGWVLVTIVLGLSFIGLELSEFIADVQNGATMQRSAFLSAFFTLVGMHGCHVTFGIFWMTSVLIQVAVRGINTVTAPKVFIVGLYWHFLDVVWVFIFTVVYLIGELT
ncbi:cytochrome c oxidase subunit 3 [Alicyclobacillus ferrooxydans]|uniref:Cytochrome o ubiquinol oxidase subunit III n=1 Tax=Alicyclobacillus ferrooxydans TaxID=471514 RepID=A0A0P9CB13_9BACL|nr:cytochrome c oxidase subunit 3 [Alicyclobacillus ferrooxydans]KPV42622.1 cytochrome o ubiquinol oxidase subunit III [Alicyclobacillus ferrooxydans]